MVIKGGGEHAPPDLLEAEDVPWVTVACSPLVVREGSLCFVSEKRLQEPSTVLNEDKAKSFKIP